MSTKPQRIAGWILTGLVALFLIGVSGVPKFFEFPPRDEMTVPMGIPVVLLPTLGVLEIDVSLVDLIPRTSFVGAILMTGNLGGAIFTPLCVGDPWWFPISVGVLARLRLALRQPILLRLVTVGSTTWSPESETRGTRDSHITGQTIPA